MKSQDAFRSNVKSLMERQGLRVKDLADMVGLSPSYLSLVLSGGRANLSDQRKDAIALALGTTVWELYRPAEPQDVASAGVCEAGSAKPAKEPEHGVDETFVLRRKRDIGPFEDLLHALNVTDKALLLAFYRELNSLSDDEVRTMGSMFRRILASWRDSRERESLTPQGTGESAEVSGPDERTLLWLVLRLCSLFGEATLDFVRIACGWPEERLHRVLESLASAGAVQIVHKDAATGAGHEIDRIAVRPKSGMGSEQARDWVPLSSRRKMLLALARSFDHGEHDAPTEVETAGARPDQLAQLYLEAGELRMARSWYERAALQEVSSGMWRLAKDHLLVVSSLDNILGTPAGDRVPAIQMLAAVCSNLGDIDEALVYQERNIAYWEKAGPPSDLVRGLLMASSILARRRDWAKAEERLDRALRVSHGDCALEARVRLGLASLLAERGRLTRCREECEAAMDLGGKACDQALVAEATLRLGRVFLWRKDFARAAQYLNRALSLSEHGEAALMQWTRIEMAKLRFEEGAFAAAREHLDRVVGTAGAVSDPAVENAARALLSRCIARASSERDLDLQRSLAYSARDFFFGVDDRRGLVWALLACAEAEAASGKAAEADALFRESVSEGRRSENPVLEAEACEAYASYLDEHDDVLAQVMRERARWARAKIR